ncbi:HK97-gp10 family putative phage morphogenesis protein [Edaphobacter modestus]|uniref:HK97 gp10 family phage protein n=1 Tax=Edaphobacter modestus TaxID=388466 RepID=A0A4Q7YNV1_9BACT|nr:HK97-gp10 family putative phage morphogenesis protein [Edaphobacter modestus]RZU39327.1 HK97 gp10 family phage protein [Edaphobacter modestus]
MPDGISIDIKGLSETKAMLENLSTKAADAAIRTALRAGAAIEVAAIEERAPVNETGGGTLPPGALANDISVTMTRSDQGNIAAIVGPGKLTRHAANWVEYGHRMVTGGRSTVIKSGRNAGKTKGPGSAVGDVDPHPFIRPAFEATAEQVAQTIADTLAEEVTAAAKKGK